MDDLLRQSDRPASMLRNGPNHLAQIAEDPDLSNGHVSVFPVSKLRKTKVVSCYKFEHITSQYNAWWATNDPV